MNFRSILFPDARADESRAAPTFFSDLNLGQVVDAIVAGRDEYDLRPFFHMPLRDGDAIHYRHEIMRDMECVAVFEGIKRFSSDMRLIRLDLARAKRANYDGQKQRWFLDAADAYCNAVRRLVHHLSAAHPTSSGLSAFHDYAAQYVSSNAIIALTAHTEALKRDLTSIHYCTFIRGLDVHVKEYEGEIDYSVEVEKTFERFKQGAVQKHAFAFSDSPEMNHVEAQILDLVIKLHPDIFLQLQRFCETHELFLDATIVRFDREIQFYVSYLEYIARFRKVGLKFCYPRIVHSRKDIRASESFDLALAGKLLSQQISPVCNDFHLQDRERIIVVSGPNQGGKTTFARAFGQLHYLACLGCLVPAAEAQLFLYDQLFTHFEKEEDPGSLRGKLQDDLIRIHDIVKQATPNSIVVINEIFASTTLHDAILLGKKIATQLLGFDLLCVWITFIDELASLNPQIVSMVSTVVPDNPALRTYKIVRRPADGLAYALSIAEKYRVTYAMIKERIGI